MRTVGAGVGTQLLSDHESDSPVLEEAYLYSRVPGRQTVPRSEAWALYLVLQVWDGSYDLTIVTDATYTISGTDMRKRHQHLKGVNGDIWRLILDEIDGKAAAHGLLDLVKLKSHSEAKHLLCRGTPLWQPGVNDLADAAADLFSDWEGSVYQQSSFKHTEAKHKAVCLRIAALEAGIRKGTPDRPRTEEAITAAARTRGENQRMRASAVSASRTNKALNVHGHQLRFTPAIDRPHLCKACKRVVHTGIPPPDNCSRCGPERGTWGCLKCTIHT